MWERVHNSSVMKNDESRNWGNKKTKHTKFSKKQTFLTRMCAYQVKKCSFFGKFDGLCFLFTSVLNSSFCLITSQKMKFSIKDFFSKCDEIRSFLQIWLNLLKKSLMENFIFCEVYYRRISFLIQDHCLDFVMFT